jgi:hypothetical protein
VFDAIYTRYLKIWNAHNPFGIRSSGWIAIQKQLRDITLKALAKTP